MALLRLLRLSLALLELYRLSLALLRIMIRIIEGYCLEDCEDWDLDDIMDLDDENENHDDDTFLGRAGKPG